MPENGENHYYGIYRGTVLSNIDPMQKARLLLQVPDVAALLPTTWAMPCVPFAGIQSGAYMLPPIGSGVWVQFEQGNPDYPVWIGGWWGSAAEVPARALAPPPVPPGQNIVVQTTAQNTLIISDSAPTPATGGIVLKSTTGAMIVVNDSGIYIQNGKGASITLIGPTVAVNVSALVVT